MMGIERHKKENWQGIGKIKQMQTAVLEVEALVAGRTSPTAG